MNKRMTTLGIMLILLLKINLASANIIGDINGDGIVGLQEALFALQVASGQHPNFPDTCVLTGAGIWGPGQNYTECDTVSHVDNFYVALVSNTSENGNAPDIDTMTWGLLPLKGEKGDIGPIGEQGDRGLTGLTGSQGLQGIQGEPGDTGSQGIQGIQGETGLQGPPGPIGGTNGQFIYNNENSAAGANMFYSGGNVGIGKTDPSERLEVNGHFKFSTGGDRFILLPDSTKSLFIGGKAPYHAPWVISNSSVSHQTFATNNEERMRINN